MAFQALDLALDLIRSLRPVAQRLRSRDAALCRQLRSAASSVALNLGEGSGRLGQARRHHFSIALGSGLEVGKCFEVEAADGAAWYEITRIGATSVEVEWRDYGRDRCMDEMLRAGGEFPRPLIERLARRHDLLQELFEALA